MATGLRVSDGITPACAGKRLEPALAGGKDEDHPRMCGEKPTLRCPCLPYRGSPPRMRGKGIVNVFVSEKLRITPACAGKSWSNALPCSRREDHPRMCGEKGSARRALPLVAGSPPHVRGKVQTEFCMIVIGKDHPRVCGEKYQSGGKALSYSGSPPRMRGKASTVRTESCGTGITPAYAGKSGRRTSTNTTGWGSPPRMRGKD